MAVKLAMMRRGVMLMGVDPYSIDEIKKIGREEIVSVTLTRMRCGGHHRKFWKLMTMIFETQDVYNDIEDMVDDIKIAIGHSRQRTDRHGEVFIMPKSISFSSMDQAAFEKFYEKVIAFCLAEILPGVTRPDFDVQFLSVVDGVNYEGKMR